MRRNLITLTFEKKLSNSTIYKVFAKNSLIGYFVLPEEIFISTNDPFVIEKIENISDEAKQYLMSKLNIPKKEDKLKKGIAVSYFLRICRLAGLSKVVIDGIEYNLPEWNRVKILPEYFYVPKCQKYVDGLDYRCPRCCGYLTKMFCEPMIGVSEEDINRVPKEKRKYLQTFTYEFPETNKRGVIYYVTSHPCVFSVQMTCTLPWERRSLKCIFYPGLVARITNGTLILSRNIKSCQRKSSLKLSVKVSDVKIVQTVQETIKINLGREIMAYRRLQEFTGSRKVELIIEKLREEYAKLQS